MKKDTVTTFLDKLEREAKRVKDEALRKAKLNAIQQCRRWLNRAWADMLSPVEAKLEAITTEAKPLIEKEEQQTLTKDDAALLQRTRAIYTICYQFYEKIYPTAHRAAVERRVRQEPCSQGKRVSNRGANVLAWSQQSGDAPSYSDVCLNCFQQLEVDAHYWDSLLTPYHYGEPQGDDGWGGNIERTNYDAYEHRCKVCGTLLKGMS